MVDFPCLTQFPLFSVPGSYFAFVMKRLNFKRYRDKFREMKAERQKERSRAARQRETEKKEKDREETQRETE